MIIIPHSGKYWVELLICWCESKNGNYNSKGHSKWPLRLHLHTCFWHFLPPLFVIVSVSGSVTIGNRTSAYAMQNVCQWQKHDSSLVEPFWSDRQCVPVSASLLQCYMLLFLFLSTIAYDNNIDKRDASIGTFNIPFAVENEFHSNSCGRNSNCGPQTFFREKLGGFELIGVRNSENFRVEYAI